MRAVCGIALLLTLGTAEDVWGVLVRSIVSMRQLRRHRRGFPGSSNGGATGRHHRRRPHRGQPYLERHGQSGCHGQQ